MPQRSKGKGDLLREKRSLGLGQWWGPPYGNTHPGGPRPPLWMLQTAGKVAISPQTPKSGLPKEYVSVISLPPPQTSVRGSPEEGLVRASGVCLGSPSLTLDSEGNPLGCSEGADPSCTSPGTSPARIHANSANRKGATGNLARGAELPGRAGGAEVGGRGV